MLPTPVPRSASELAIPKVQFKGKLVTDKKSNSPFFVHQRHLSKQINNQRPTPHRGPQNYDDLNEKKDSKDSSSPSKQKVLLMNTLTKARPLLSASFHYSLIIILFSLLLSRMITENWFWGYDGKYTQWKYFFPGPQKLFTLETLSEYDGVKDPSKPLLLAINGVVYNVNSNRNMYGPGASYHQFVGKDASRAFVTGCFKSGLTHDLRGLNNKQKKSIDYWANFYENSPKYFRVGKVKLPELGESDPIPQDCDPSQEGGTFT